MSGKPSLETPPSSTTSGKRLDIKAKLMIHNLLRPSKLDQARLPSSHTLKRQPPEEKPVVKSKPELTSLLDVAPVVKPLLDSSIPIPLLHAKSLERNDKKQRNYRPQGQRKSQTNDTDDKTDDSPPSNLNETSIIAIVYPSNEQLQALKICFNKIINEKFLSSDSILKRRCLVENIIKSILQKRPDCRIETYGSVYFECCLEQSAIIDIDVQFCETLHYDTLKELLKIIQQTEYCNDAKIDPDHKPSCITMYTKGDKPIRVRITSGYTRGIYLSKLIQLYTKFDIRTLKLMRLFRYLAKVCNIDDTEYGTLHPIVYHILVIHFLQQIEPPILPVLHEHVHFIMYGINNVPVTLNEQEHQEFFKACNEFEKSHTWKSKNKSSVEELFLQLLAYYLQIFSVKQLVVSIQTKMPILKVEKNWHNRKLLVEDPTDIKRSLCHTMQAKRSLDYFSLCLRSALLYFGRKQISKNHKQDNKNSEMENPNDDFIVIESDDVSENLLQLSFQTFAKSLPQTIFRDHTIRQGRVREYYIRSYTEPLPKPWLTLNNKNAYGTDGTEWENEVTEEVEEAFRHDIENDYERMDDNDRDDEIPTENILYEEENEENGIEIETFEEENEQNGIHQDVFRSSSMSEGEQQQQFVNTSPETPSLNTSHLSDEEKSSQNSPEKGLNSATDDIGDDNNKGQVLNERVLEENLASTVEANSSSIDKTVVTDEILSIASSAELLSTKHTVFEPSTSSKIFATNSLSIEELLPSALSSPTNVNDEQTIITSTDSEYFYNFLAENFGAEQGAPYYCTICNGSDHLKSKCPEMIMPDLAEIKSLSKIWLDKLSEICHEITCYYEPTESGIRSRKQILCRLENLFKSVYPECTLHAFGSFYNGFGFKNSDLDICVIFKDITEYDRERSMQIMQKLLSIVRSCEEFCNVIPVLHAKVPIIRSKHESEIDIDISLHNTLARENTRLLHTYSSIDTRVAQLGYMLKFLAKTYDIGDASQGTLSSYSYIIMLIHFLQQITPPVLPILQQPKIWKSQNTSCVGELWIEFLRYYTETFNYEEHIVSIRRLQPLSRWDKGWFRLTLAIEDPFELSHNLAGGLSIRNWIFIRRVLIHARKAFVSEPSWDISNATYITLEPLLFNVAELRSKRCENSRHPYYLRKKHPKFGTRGSEKEREKQQIKTQNGSYQRSPANQKSKTNGYREESKNQPRYNNRSSYSSQNGFDASLTNSLNNDVHKSKQTNSPYNSHH
ncbi:unnamed protein product [Didymodactylos carnosus]|uniref:Uncharacterized protein n=1 Tax=Didymodactylos carnosus TaxID=1234261 RepID=A0A8S2GEZ2_9BILA|nr:unnamed protein product [Didymodactylos carnosus]CAF3506646.1 unnamed protein product [Didymodactylos carnosus]